MNEATVSLTKLEAEARASVIADCAYQLELDLADDPDRYTFHVRLEFTGEPGAVTFVDAEVNEIERMLWQDKPLGLEAVAGQRIHLPALKARNVLEVWGRSHYHRAGLGLHLAIDPADGERYLYSDLEPAEAHRVFPCFDQPDLKATFQLRVRVPQDWTVVSAEPGRAGAAADSDGARWWDFPTTPRISPYVLGIAAGRLHAVRRHHHGIDLALYAPLSLGQDLEKAAGDIFEVTGQGLDFYRELFGIPYPFTKYDQVFCLEKVNGAMESPGCVTITDRMIFRGRPSERERSQRAEVILHEMAHMWFGDMVTLRWWDDLWLNESFATFMAAVATDRATGFHDAWTVWITAFKRLAVEEDQHTTSHPVVTAVPDAESVHANFDRITYQKGSAVLRQLAAWVGEDSFFAGVHEHLERNRWGNATLHDLLRAVGDASGRDVVHWSQLWLETVGINTINLEIQSAAEASGSGIEAIHAVQSARPSQPTLRPHRLAVGLYDWMEGSLQRRRRLEIDIDSEHTAIPELVGETRPPLLLPNDEALTYAKIRLDPVSMATVEGHLGEVDDALARAIVWDALQDMVRDAEFPASRLVRVVARHLPQETDESLIPVVLASARGALALYGARSAADQLEADLADACATALEATEAGTSRQLSWLRAFISSAITPQQLDRCQEMLEGRKLPDGVVLDLELRWRLVTALASRGVATVDDVTRMRRADRTSTGIVRGLAAQAAMPVPEVKEQVFKFLTEDDSATVEAALWAGSSLGGVRQDALLLPYIPRFFDAVSRLRERRGVEYSRDFAYWSIGALPPHPDLLAALERELARTELDADLRRIYQEALEEAEIALRAREVDEEEVARQKDRATSPAPVG